MVIITAVFSPELKLQALDFVTEVQVMICNVSPAKINVDETLSSLRFAERAKKIENKAMQQR